MVITVDTGDAQHISSSSGVVTQSCLPLCSPKGCSSPGSSVHGILQAILEWVAIPFSRGSPEDLPDLGIEPRSPALQVDSLLSEPPVHPYHNLSIKTSFFSFPFLTP